MTTIFERVVGPDGTFVRSSTVGYRQVGSTNGHEESVSDPRALRSLQGYKIDKLDTEWWVKDLPSSEPMAPANNFVEIKTHVQGRGEVVRTIEVPDSPPSGPLTSQLVIPSSGSFSIAVASANTTFDAATPTAPKAVVVDGVIVLYTGATPTALTGCTTYATSGTYPIGTVVAQAYWVPSIDIDPPVGLPTLLAELLSSTAGAASVGTTAITGLTGSTVQAMLASAQANIAAEAVRATTQENLKLAKASNLSDVANPATALANIGGIGPIPAGTYPLNPTPGTVRTAVVTDLLDQSLLGTYSFAVPPSVTGKPVDVKTFGITVAGTYYPPPLDGVSTPLYGIPGLTLAAAQARYPFITSLTQQRDFAAFQLAIDTVLPGYRLTGQLPNGPAVPSAPVTWTGKAYIGADRLVIRGARGFRLLGGGMWVSQIIGSGSQDSHLWIDGCTWGHFSGFLVLGGSPKYGIYYGWSLTDTAGGPGTGKPLVSSSGCLFDNVGVMGCGFTQGAWGVGSEFSLDAGTQVDGSTWVSCIVSGAYAEGSGNTTTYQHAWKVGSSSYGNNYGHSFYGCSASGTRYAFGVYASGIQVFGWQGGRHEAVLHLEGAAAPITLDTLRSENSCLINSAGGASYTAQIAVRNVTLNKAGGASGPAPAGGRVIDLNGYAGALSIDGLRVTNWEDIPDRPVIRMAAAAHPQTAAIDARNLSMPVAVESAFVTNSSLNIVATNYIETDQATDGGLFTTAWWVNRRGNTVLTTGVGETQRVTITGNPTGGTFPLTFEGQTTVPEIPYNATAATVQTALTALSNVGAGNAVCWGGPLPATPVYVGFIGTLGASDRTQMSTSSANLTGGSSPAVAISTPSPGIHSSAQFNRLRLNAYTSTDVTSSDALRIRPYSAADIGLTIKAQAGQTGKLMQVLDSADNALFEVRNTGAAYVRGNAGATSGLLSASASGFTFGTETNHPTFVVTNNAFRSRWEANGNIGLNQNRSSYANGVGVIGIGDATTAPTSNPSAGGGLLYSEGGTLKWRNPSGDIFSSAKASAYTQTYATADKTHAARTAAAVSTAASTQATPWGYASQAQADDIITQVNNLRQDQLDTAQALNALIDDLQAAGLVG